MNTLYDFYWRRRSTSASLRRAVVVSIVLHVLLLAAAVMWVRQRAPMAIGTIYEVQFGSNVPLAAASKGGAVGEESENLSPPPKVEQAPEPEPEPEPPKVEPPKPPEPKPEPPPPPPPPKETPKVVKKEEKPKEEKPKPPDKKKEATDKKPQTDDKKKADAQKDKKKTDKQMVASADQPEKDNQSDKPVTGYGKGQKGDQIGQPKGDPNLPPGPGVNMGEGLPTILTTWGSLVQIKVQRIWEIPSSVLYGGGKNEVTISFWVNREGYVLGEPEIMKSVGDSELGVSAVKAIKAAVPLPPLPESYAEPEVQVVCTFVPTE
ncbi:MAG: TonB family protein [Candidatus Hydrogenedentes bacterium]|nr:TonB family protein [Candidatus Hydrogenedentota bacterium]